jgi:hypothetical protein
VDRIVKATSPVGPENIVAVEIEPRARPYREIMKKAPAVLGLVTLFAASACGSSYAETNRGPAWSGTSDHDTERTTSPQVSGYRPSAPWSDPASVAESPYRVELLYGDSGRLPTFYSGGRAYVLGTIGERYRVHITNPTSRRVEAVVSVDGLDAIDGRTAGYDDKRGYVIAPYGEITVDGFRTSMDQIATFRFSSVRDSYAGRKGQDRNVGVIGVAFFPEREHPVAIVPRPSPYHDDRPRSSAGAPSKRADDEGLGRAPGSPPPAPSAAAESRAADGAGSYSGSPRREARRGLGTEFGEQRHSSVGYTSFQRESAHHPASVIELRYNDREGLLALGIAVDRPSYRNDVSLRESAEPFPQSRFAAPPPR